MKRFLLTATVLFLPLAVMAQVDPATPDGEKPEDPGKLESAS